MAITATDRGTGSNNSAGTSIVISPGSNMAAGSTGILCLAMDNAGGGTTNLSATSYADSVGNTWYVRISRTEGTANANEECAFLTAYLTTGFTTSDTLTVNFSNSTTAKAWTWVEATSNLTSGAVLWSAAASASCMGTAVSATSTPTFTTTVFPTQGDLSIGMTGSESADILSAGDSDTTNGSWSTAQHVGVGTGATGMAVYTQNKVVNAFGTQTYNPTLTTTADCRTGIINLAEVDVTCRSISGNSTSESSTAINLSRKLTSGSIGVLCLSTDNAGTSGNTTTHPSSITDSQSNTWTRRLNGFCDPGAANAGVELSVYTSVLTTNLDATDTLTATWVGTNVASKTWVVLEIAPAGAGVMSYVTGSFGNNSGGSPSTTPQVTTGSITSGDYVIGVTGSEVEDSLTGDSDSTNGTWRPQSMAGRGSGSTAMSCYAQIKKVTATATQSYDATFASSVDWATAWIEINDSTPTGISTAQKASFFNAW